MFENPLPPLSPHIKSDRGFEHDITGRLLCPIDFDWDDPQWELLSLSAIFQPLLPSKSVRQSIRDGHPDFLVTADSWPGFLYPHAKANQNDMEHGLLQSAMLVKVRCTYVCTVSDLQLMLSRPSNLSSPHLHLPKISLVRTIWKIKRLDHLSAAEPRRHQPGATLQACWEWDQLHPDRLLILQYRYLRRSYCSASIYNSFFCAASILSVQCCCLEWERWMLQLSCFLQQHRWSFWSTSWACS